MPLTGPTPDLQALCERYRRGDRGALARLLTLAARGDATWALLRQAGFELPSASLSRNEDPREGEGTSSAAQGTPVPGRSIAVTGSGGVGKSSLIGALAAHLESSGNSVAVLACDPQSTETGGALLGDRCRIAGFAADQKLFIRSLPALSGHQGLAEHTDLLLALVRGFGFDVVFVETVGTGQGDTAVRALVDIVLLVLQPETGDELQWEKAGLLEAADLVVVNKSDLPGSEQTASDVQRLLNLPGCRPVPVLLASTARGTGISELWSALNAHPPRRMGPARDGRALLQLAQSLLAERFAANGPRAAAVLARWQSRQIDDADAARELLALLASPD